MSVSGDGPAGSQYDQFADAHGDGGPYNELYERPAMISMLGDVAGRTVLDVGCGSGLLAEHLASAGANVIGLDGSDAMLQLARARLGAKGQLRLHDLHEPLTWLANGSIDIVVASLVMHYIKDWRPALGEFRRVLRPGGRLVMSTHHPFADFITYSRPNYFAVEEIVDQWGKSDAKYEVRFWRRPLQVLISDLVHTGFRIKQLAEPVPSSWEGFTERERLWLSSNPTFLFIEATPTATLEDGYGAAV